MKSPSVEILEYGVFDSNVKFPKIKITRERPVEFYELELYTADCPGKTCLDGSWYPLLCGTFICAKPGQRRRSQLPFKCHYIHLSVSDPQICQLLERIPTLFQPEQLQEVMQLFNGMLAVDSPELPENRLLLMACLFRLLSYLSQYKFLSAEVQAGRAFSHQKALLAAEKYIRENLASPLPLATLAARCSLSPVYFHTLFTDFFGKTPARYILDCRIARAKTELLTGDRPLAELAADCGFSSQSYFSYKFKESTGKTPLQYRKDMLGRLRL